MVPSLQRQRTESPMHCTALGGGTRTSQKTHKSVSPVKYQNSLSVCCCDDIVLEIHKITKFILAHGLRGSNPQSGLRSVVEQNFMAENGWQRRSVLLVDRGGGAHPPLSRVTISPQHQGWRSAHQTVTFGLKIKTITNMFKRTVINLSDTVLLGSPELLQVGHEGY